MVRPVRHFAHGVLPILTRALLRGVQKTLGELAADEEFAAFRDTPGIFRQAAVYYPDDPRAFLRGCRRP
jgi:hypothetical protein